MGTEARPSSHKPRLGRGLSSLISSSIPPTEGSENYQPVAEGSGPGKTPQPLDASPTKHREIPIEQIAPNPFQPRQRFDPTDLGELAASIRQHGLIQPLVVAPVPGSAERPYALIAGERRLRAAEQAGVSAVACIVREASPREMLEWALVENIQRKDLNAIERAEGYRAYIDQFRLTQADAAQRLGQPRATVANYLRMLDLCDEARRLLMEGRLSFGHGKVLASLTGAPERQGQLARRAAEGGWSVRQLEEAVEAGGARAGGKKARTETARPAYLADLEARLTEAVGTRVRIQPGRRRHSGRIVVDYYSLEDFDRISGAFGLKGEE